jgi:hypothetical protein
VLNASQVLNAETWIQVVSNKHLAPRAPTVGQRSPHLPRWAMLTLLSFEKGAETQEERGSCHQVLFPPGEGSLKVTVAFSMLPRRRMLHTWMEHMLWSLRVWRGSMEVTRNSLVK